MNKFEAMILFPFVFFKKKKDWVPPSVMVHEQIHLNQIDRDGVLKFYLVYSYHFLRNLIEYKNINRAYLEVPYEKEAYETTRSICS